MRLANKVFQLLIAHYKWVLFLQVVLLGWLAYQAQFVRFDAGADSLVLEGDTALDYSREIGERYGKEDFLLVTYAPMGDLFSDDTLQRIANLRDELAEVQTVSSVVSILDVPLLYSPPITVSRIRDGLPTLADADTDRALAAQEFINSPVYKSLLTNGDNSVTALQVNLERDQEYFRLLGIRDELRERSRRGDLRPLERRALRAAELAFDEYRYFAAQRQQAIVAEVREILEGYRSDATIHLGGVPMIAVDLVAFVQQDLLVFGTVILLFILVLLMVIFRRPRWVLIPVFICGVTAVEMLGWLSFIDWRLTVISANFIAILLIVNLSIVVHLLVRYRELAARDKDASQAELLQQTLAFMLKPCVYTTLTTLVAFASLVVSGIRPVIDFGWMMVIGVSLALVNTFVLFAALSAWLGREKPMPQSTSMPFTHVFAGITERYGNWVLFVSVVVLGLGVLGVSRLEVENRFIDYFDSSTEIYRGMETIDHELGGTMPLDVIIDYIPEPEPELDLAEGEEDLFADDDFADDGFEEDPFDDGVEGESSVWYTRNGLEQITEIHLYLESLPETGKVLSLATIFEISRDLVGEGIDNVELAITRKNLPSAVNDVLIAPYLDDEINQARLSMRVMETSPGLRRDDFLKQVKADIVTQFDLEPEQVHLTGMMVLYNNMLQSLFTSQILTLGAVFGAILLMFLVLFRSLGLALIAVTPNILAALTVLGGMGLAGIPLDMMTITIAAITIGIGVDDTIHYVHRFKREFAKDGIYLATMYRCHDSIGKAMYYTSVIVVFGFGILTLSNFRPSIFFGLLTGVAMLAALLGALLLLPRLILLFKPLGPERAAS